MSEPLATTTAWSIASESFLKDESVKNFTVGRASCKANKRKSERVVAQPPHSHTAHLLSPFLCLLCNLLNWCWGFWVFHLSKSFLSTRPCCRCRQMFWQLSPENPTPFIKSFDGYLDNVWNEFRLLFHHWMLNNWLDDHYWVIIQLLLSFALYIILAPNLYCHIITLSIIQKWTFWLKPKHINNTTNTKTSLTNFK